MEYHGVPYSVMEGAECRRVEGHRDEWHTATELSSRVEWHRVVQSGVA